MTTLSWRREKSSFLRLPHQLNGYILLKARYKRHIAFASGAGNTIAMANRRCDFRSFCGATERIRNAGAKCLEEPQWAGVSTPSVAITSVLTWHYPLLVPDFKPQPSPVPNPNPNPNPIPIPVRIADRRRTGQTNAVIYSGFVYLSPFYLCLADANFHGGGCSSAALVCWWPHLSQGSKSGGFQHPHIHVTLASPSAPTPCLGSYSNQAENKRNPNPPVVAVASSPLIVLERHAGQPVMKSALKKAKVGDGHPFVCYLCTKHFCCKYFSWKCLCYSGFCFSVFVLCGIETFRIVASQSASCWTLSVIWLNTLSELFSGRTFD